MSEVAAAIDAGMIVGQVRQIEKGGALIPLPHTAVIHDLEKFLPVPAYAKAKVNARTVAALIAYVGRHGKAESAIFADVEAGRVQAVVDYLSAGNDPAHKAHVCEYAAPFSEEWKRWTGIDSKKMPQAEFARFIEENREDIVTPDGATMLELSKTLDAKRKVAFKSGMRLDNGDYDLEYKDETTATGGGIDGKIAIPSEIELGIPVFYGGDRYKIKALFRYRIEDGKLVMWIDLHRSKHIRDAAFADIIETVKAGCPETAIYEAALS